MKRYWQPLADKIDAMSLRERALIFAMLAAVVVSLMNLLLIDPLMAKQKRLAQKLADEQTQMAQVQSTLEAMLRARSLDPDALNRDRLQSLKQRMAEMEKSLEDVQQGLVPHDKMPAMLEDMLRRQQNFQAGRLQLVSLKTLPAAPLVAETASGTAKAGGAEQTPALVYKHGVELTVQGGYHGLLGYLDGLEKMPWRMFWGEARLDARDYPKVRLTLTVYTLSLDKAWLSI